MSVGIINFNSLNKTTILPLEAYQFERIYSLRRVYSSATKSIRLRRASDGAETDIGFIDEDLDISSIASFCGSSDGQVQTFYDQSGNNADANFIQYIRFKIYDGTTGISLQNGKPSCFASGGGYNHTQGQRYEFTQTDRVESVYFVGYSYMAGGMSTYLYNSVRLLGGGSVVSAEGLGPSQNVQINFMISAGQYAEAPKFGMFAFGNTPGAQTSRGYGYLSPIKTRLHSWVYDPTEKKYLLLRDAEEGFGNISAVYGAGNILNQYPRVGVSVMAQGSGFEGHFQEILIGASGSNTGLNQKEEIRQLQTNYWNLS